MALTACRECGQQVSTEAAACPHCGAGSPTTPEPLTPIKDKSGAYWFGIACAAVIVALVVAFGGYRWWQSQQGIVVSGPELEQKIVETYSGIAPTVTLYASCPKTPRLRKDKIVDCSVERSDDGKSSAVFITPTDDSGHFRIQMADTAILFAP